MSKLDELRLLSRSIKDIDEELDIIIFNLEELKHLMFDVEHICEGYKFKVIRCVGSDEYLIITATCQNSELMRLYDKPIKNCSAAIKQIFIKNISYIYEKILDDAKARLKI